MQTEIEAKFLNIDHDAMRQKLTALGATLEQPMRLMRRKNYDFPDRRLDAKSGWVRVRDEAGKVTLAYKQLNHRGLDGTKEVSVTVSDFEETGRFLKQIGLVPKSYQETKRETWLLEGATIELDEWPWVRPFMEIEAGDEELLLTVIKMLGLSIENALHGSVEVVYMHEYDVTEQEVDDWERITFVSVPEWLESKRR